MQFWHYAHTTVHKSGFQEVSAETDAVDSLCGIVAITLSGSGCMPYMHYILFHLPRVIFNDGVSPTAAAVVAAPILKLCDV